MLWGKKSAGSICIEESVYKRVLKCDEEPVLMLTIQVPKLPEDNSAQRYIARYYHRMADIWKMRWEVNLYTLACSTMREARETSRPFHPFESQLTYTVTYNECGFLSLYLDSYEYTGGAHGMTVRYGDTWDIRTGTPCLLPSFFPQNSQWHRTTIAVIREQIKARLATGESAYFDDWSAATATEFNPRNFYLAGEGITVFYQLYTLAPYVEGITTFLVHKWPSES